ncbi:hypothetical protein [Sneathiella chinensis]|nr:hypothetical protein [Sneathiella chinensis]
MKITQVQVDALQKWVSDRSAAYMAKGLSLAATSGVEELSDFREGGLRPEDNAKSLAELKAEWTQAEEFYRDARQLLFAGRQGG